MSLTVTGDPPVPSWLITHSYEDRDAGVLKSGKEAEVFLVERVGADGASCLLAHKRYRPRYPKKGELQELGFSKGTIYRADAVYQAGWGLKARDRRALEQGSLINRVAQPTYPLANIVAAHQAVERGTTGNVIVTL